MADLADPDLLAYLQAERAFYDETTARLGSRCDAMRQRLRDMVPTDELGAPWRHAGWEYRWERRGDAEHPRLVRRPADENDAGEAPAPERPASWATVLDLESLAGPDGHVELGVCAVSPSSRLLAYSVDTTGDEVFDLRFVDLESGAELTTRVTGVHHGGAWAGDSSGFVFVVPDAAWRAAELRHVSIGDPGGQAAHVGTVVVVEPDEAFSLDIRLTRSHDWLVVTSASSATTEQFLIPGSSPTAAPVSVAGRNPGVEYAVDHRPGPDGGDLVAVTNDGETEFRLVRAPVPTGDGSGGGVGRGVRPWESLVPPRAGERLLAVDAFAEHLVLSLRKNGHASVRVLPHASPTSGWDLDPPAGASIALGRNPDLGTRRVQVVTEATVLPPSTDEIDLATGVRTPIHQEDVPGHDPSAYVTERRMLAARDGVDIPVVLVRHRQTGLDGTAACLVYGYGAYEAVVDPWFDPATVALLDSGIVFVHAHVRGGGEVGRRWWEQGRLAAKPTSWLDLVDVVDALGRTGLVDHTRVAVRGMSAGGLLVAGAMQQRPEAFAAVVAEVPFVDVVTTMLDEFLPLTTLEWTEWGDPKDPEGFASMLAWSPYDGTRQGERPALLVTGALHDTRVRVTEPAKWVARMRELDAEAGRDPSRLLLRAETGEGAHGGPSGRFARIDYEAEIATWLLDTLGC